MLGDEIVNRTLIAWSVHMKGAYTVSMEKDGVYNVKNKGISGNEMSTIVIDFPI